MAKTYDREQPIVMVQMDDDAGFSISNEPDKKIFCHSLQNVHFTILSQRVVKDFIVTVYL